MFLALSHTLTHFTHSNVLTLSYYNWWITREKWITRENCNMTSLHNRKMSTTISKLGFSVAITLQLMKDMLFLVYSLYIYSFIISYIFGTFYRQGSRGHKNKKHDSCLQRNHNLGEGIRQVSKKAR